MTTVEEPQDVKLEVAQKVFLCKTKGLPGVDSAKLQQEILDVIYAGDLAPLYEWVCAQLSIPVDAARLATMKEKNAATLAELESKIKDAEENLGETEVRDALLAKANFLCSIGDRDAAVEAYAATEAKTAGSGNKVDLVFNKLRLFMAYGDMYEVKSLLARAKQLCSDGGDWERKNKLKVYQGVFAMQTRDFKLSANLFLDSIATFTATELFPYTRVIFYAVVISMLALDRVSLKKKVVDAPEILTVIGQVPGLAPYLNSLYNCKYKDFFKAFVGMIDEMKSDMYLSPHIRYYMREIRVAAYVQFLESYKSVTLDSMAAAFDVSIEFLDQELSDFIVAGRINAKIDKVSNIVETTKPDAKNALYQESIKKGDILLNRIQKLSKWSAFDSSARGTEPTSCAALSLGRLIGSHSETNPSQLAVTSAPQSSPQAQHQGPRPEPTARAQSVRSGPVRSEPLSSASAVTKPSRLIPFSFPGESAYRGRLTRNLRVSSPAAYTSGAGSSTHPWTGYCRLQTPKVSGQATCTACSGGSTYSLTGYVGLQHDSLRKTSMGAVCCGKRSSTQSWFGHTILQKNSVGELGCSAHRLAGQLKCGPPRTVQNRLVVPNAIGEDPGSLADKSTPRTGFSRSENPSQGSSGTFLLGFKAWWSKFIGKASYDYYLWRKDTGSDLQLFALFFLGLILIGSFVKSVVVTGRPPAGAMDFWGYLYDVLVLSFAQDLPPKAQASMAEQMFSVLTAYAGLLSFAMVLALVEQVVLEVIDSNVNRGSMVYETKHTLILGWGSSQRDMELATFRRAIPESERHGVDIVFRVGNPLLSSDLAFVAAEHAAVSIIVSDHSRSPLEADAQSAR
eukprot:gene25811-11486_t